MSQASTAVSAPGQLQQQQKRCAQHKLHDRHPPVANKMNKALNDNVLAPRLCNSLTRLSKSTKFQRVQRQFSLASFTENGMLTKRGMHMSNNIPKARNILFRRPPPKPFLSKSNENQKATTIVDLNPINSYGSNSISDSNYQKAVSDYPDYPLPAADNLPEKINENDDRNNTGNIKLIEPNENNVYIENKRSSGIKFSIQRREPRDHRILQESIRHNSKTDTNNASENKTMWADPVDQDVISDTNKYAQTTATLISKSSPQFDRFMKSPKKKVTILSHVDHDETTKDETLTNGDVQYSYIDFQDGNQHDSDNISDSKSNGRELGEVDWSSIFSRPHTAPKLNPLQEKINTFLADQTKFNRIFPKGDEVKPEVHCVQKELRKKAKVRQQIQQEETKKKNEIVVEVLSTLEIKDPNILAQYAFENRDRNTQ